VTRAPGLPVSLPAASVSLSAAAPPGSGGRGAGRGPGRWSLVFGEFAFLPFSLGPPGDCPWRH